MARIDLITVNKAKDAARIADIVGDFVQLRRKGKDYEGLCPFHDDRHMGSFVVSPSLNICSCFSCGARYDPIGFLQNIQDGHTFREAIEYICDKYSIPIEYENDKKKMIVPSIIQHTQSEELPLLIFPHDHVIRSMKQQQNNLTTWLRSLPWSDEDRQMLEKWLKLYFIGTSTNGRTDGWVAFWYIDDEMRARNCKFMAYRKDGHRDKDINPYTDASGQIKHYNFDFLASMTDKAHRRNKGKGIWSSDEARSELCLFGLHLIDCFPDAEVCIVESEKTAIIAQTASVPGQKLFMATGSKSSLTRKQLEPLIKRNRWIILYPDADGMEQWKAQAKSMGYDKIQVSPKVRELFDPTLDDPKADIGDIIVRTLCPKPLTMSQQAHNLLGIQEENKALTQLIEKFKLEIDDSHHEDEGYSNEDDGRDSRGSGGDST